MKPTIKTQLQRTLLSWGALLACLAYLSYGMFPFAIAEGDEGAVSATVEVYLAQKEMVGPYLYDALKGLYTVLPLTSTILGTDALSSYCLLTIIGFFSFLIFASIFVARLGHCNPLHCAFVLLLFQEVYTSAYYANANMIVAPIIFASLILVQRTFPLAMLGGALFAFAAWIRLDVLLMGPCLILVAHWYGNHRLKHLFSLGALIIAISLALSTTLSPWRMLSIRNKFAEHGFVGWSMSLQNLLTVLTLPVILLSAYGIKYTYQKRNLRILTLVAVAFVPVGIAYFKTLTTPKYLLYAIPFLSLLATIGAKELLARRKQLAVGLIVLSIVIQYLLPAEVLPADTKWERKTHDGHRAYFSILWQPIRWNTRKSKVRANQQWVGDRILEKMQTQHSSLFIKNWLIFNALKIRLIKDGYILTSYSNGHLSAHFERMNHKITLNLPREIAIQDPETWRKGFPNEAQELFMIDTRVKKHIFRAWGCERKPWLSMYYFSQTPQQCFTFSFSK